MQVTLCDVGPRDGLQNDTRALEPAVRAELCDRLAAAGLPRIEAVSFVNPKACRRWPAPRRSWPRSTARDGVVYAALVLNERGVRARRGGRRRRGPLRLPAHRHVRARNQNTTLGGAADTHEA